MSLTIEYYARQIVGSRTRLLLAIACQIGAFIFLVNGLGWRTTLEFAFFMVLLPSLYLWVIHGMFRGRTELRDMHAEEHS